MCDLLIFQTLALLDDEDDINQVVDYFSYEHFYVIYCKFWELDKDHDLFISKDDLAKHNDHGKNSVSLNYKLNLSKWSIPTERTRLRK